jgi:hypothetical protein
MESAIKACALMFAGLLLCANFSTVEAAPGYQTINDLNVTLNGSNYDIVIALAGDPTLTANSPTLYSVTLLPQNLLSGELSSTVTFQPVPNTTYTFRYLTPSPNIISNTYGATGAFINTVYWSIPKPSPTFTFTSALAETSGLFDGGAVIDSKNKTYSPTPIPGIAWLLGSGILGLVGLKRRS